MGNKAGVRMAGRPRLIDGERRGPVTISMTPSMYREIDAVTAIGSFSTKIEAVIQEWKAFKGLIVQYQTEEQREQGTPVRLSEFAERVYSCSQFQHGYSYKDTRYERVVQSIMDGVKFGAVHKSQTWVAETLVPALRRRGLIVQVINEIEYDLYDVWVCDLMLGEAGKHCGQCHVINELDGWVKALKESQA